MRRAAIAAVLIAALAQMGFAQAMSPLTSLVLPHPLGAGEAAWIEVQAGALRRGQEIDIKTASGQDLGTVSPFGVRDGQDAGTYALPVPEGAIRDGSLSLRITISQFGAPPRAPTAEELRSVKLTIVKKP